MSWIPAWLHPKRPAPRPEPPASPAPPPLGPITISGLDFLRGGERWVYRGATHFLLFLRYCLGEDIVPLLYPDADVYEVFGIVHQIPQQIGLRDLTVDDERYYQNLETFADLLATHRKYLAFCVFTCPDVAQLGLSQDWMIKHWLRCVEVLSPKPNVLLRLVNEPWQGGLDPSRFPRPETSLLLNRGDLLDEQLQTVTNAWDWISNHPRRDFPKMIKNCQATDYQYSLGVPVVINEPFKAGSSTIANKQYTNPRYFFQAGRLMSACNGGSFHSFHGVVSQPLDDVEEACRAAFFRGLVP